MKLKLWKNQVRKWLTITGFVAGLSGLIGSISWISSTINTPHFKTLRQDDTATVTSKTFLTKSSNQFEVVPATNTFIGFKDNELTSYSFNGFTVLTIKIAEGKKILATNAFDIAGNKFIGILSDEQKFYVYSTSNPVKPQNTFNLPQQYNKISLSSSSLYLYDDQEAVSSSSKFYLIDIIKMEGTEKSFDSNYQNKEYYLARIAPIGPTANAIIFLKKAATVPPAASSSSSLSSTDKLSQADYFIADLNLAPLANVNNTSTEPGKTGLTPFTLGFDSNVQTYDKIHLANYYADPNITPSVLNNPIGSLNRIQAAFAVGNQIVTFKPNDLTPTSIPVQISPTPSSGSSGSSTSSTPNLSAIIFKPEGATLIVDGDDKVYSLNYASKLFFQSQSLQTILNTTASETDTSKFSLISLPGTNYIVAKDNAFYGVGTSNVMQLGDKIDFKVFASGNSYSINTNTNIPLTSFQLTKNILTLTSTSTISTAKPISTYVVPNDLIFLDIDPNNTTTNKSTVTVLVPVIGSSWWDSSTSLDANVILTINNFQAFSIYLQSLWLTEAQMRTKLTRSIRQITNDYLNTSLKPLNLENLTTTPAFKIQSITYQVSDINAAGNSFKVHAFITYMNTTRSRLETIQVEKQYSLGTSVTSTKIFQVYGQNSAVNNVIPISAAIAQSNNLLAPTSANYLPSYLFRSQNPTVTAPTVNQIQEFFMRFVAQSVNLVVTPSVVADDDNGTLTISFVFDSVFQNNTNVITYTYTGFKSLKDFHVSLQGNGLTNNSFDFQTIPWLTPEQRRLDPYEISTGRKLKDLATIESGFSITPIETKKEQIQKFINSLNGSNLNLMQYEPKIENLSDQNQASLLKAIKTGNLKLKFTYSGLTQQLADHLGLDAKMSKVLTLTNLQKASDLYNFSLNKQGNKIVDQFDSLNPIDENFLKAIQTQLVTRGYQQSDVNIQYKWVNNDDLQITVSPKSNWLITGRALPANYIFNISWATKNAYLKKILGLKTGIPLGGISLMLILSAAYFYYRKTLLREFY